LPETAPMFLVRVENATLTVVRTTAKSQIIDATAIEHRDAMNPRFHSDGPKHP
jgi:hypothetical protein